MHTEVEVKFLSTQPTEIRKRLRELGATLIQPERLMRRRNYDFPGGQLAGHRAWARVRDEGGRVTMSYKKTTDTSATGTQEVNLTVDSFDAANQFLTAIGLVEKSYQETRRESWLFQEVEIEIDTWPWLDPFIELEGPTEQSLKQVANQLGLSWQNHRGGDVTPVYQLRYHAAAADIIHARITFTELCPWTARKES